MALSSLPSELLLQLSTHLKLQELGALTRASSRCYELLNPELYSRGIAAGLVMQMLFLAVERGLANTAKLCLCRRPCPPPEAIQFGFEDRPLQRATDLGHVEVVRQLLKWGFGNPNAGSGGTFQTPLKLAIFSGHINMVRVLLEHHSVDCNFEDDYNRYTPLHVAAMRGDGDIVKSLLQRIDIKPDEPDFYRRTPLSYAAERGNTDVVRLLLECNKVDRYSKDKQGMAPLDYAMIEGNTGAVKLLLSAEWHIASSSRGNSLFRRLEATMTAHSFYIYKKTGPIRAAIAKFFH